MSSSKSEETSSKNFSVGGHTYTEAERDRDYYKRHVFAENPYLAMPSVEETKHIKDRYANADKTQACYQVKWDLIHCVVESDCVRKDGRRAKECLMNKRLVSFL
ncbi:unnamed protein product [Oikopleura dioica]|uniref:Uncharacterized protein n=1 Tax=Oikopleura dioica TaxID=34765 RepID=E4XFF3_OIKDI|nr:unnamed protein product [Oikopleura dioica]CBY35363.1 unnamed protein product [Oikopleura dioica]